MPTDLDVELFVAVLTTIMKLYDEARQHWVVLAGYPPVVWRLAIGDQ